MNKITFFTDKNDYTGGDLVRGKLRLELDQAIPVRGIRLRYHGEERSEWSNGSGKSRNIYGETLSFFDEEVTLFGRPRLSAGEIIADAMKGLFSKDRYEIMEAGLYEYPFSFALPPGIPGDYEGPGNSCIRYELAAQVDIPLRIDIKQTGRLTVYETYQPAEIEPLGGQASKEFFWGQAPVKLTAIIDRSVFFPGDTLMVKVMVENPSSKRVDAIDVRVNHIINLKAGTSTTELHDTTLLGRFESCSVEPNQDKEFLLEVEIPRDLYASSLSSKLVRLSYRLAVSLDVPWAIDLTTTIPVLILERASMPSGVAS